MRTYSFRMFTKNNTGDIFEGVKTALLAVDGFKVQCGSVDAYQEDKLVCRMEVTTKENLEYMLELMKHFSAWSLAEGFLFYATYIPENTEKLTVVFKSQSVKPFEELEECVAEINKLMDYFQLSLYPIGRTTKAYFMVCDVAYSPMTMSYEDVNEYFRGCCEHYEITYNIYKEGELC